MAVGCEFEVVAVSRSGCLLGRLDRTVYWALDGRTTSSAKMASFVLCGGDEPLF